MKQKAPSTEQELLSTTPPQAATDIDSVVATKIDGLNFTAQYSMYILNKK